MSGIMPPPIFQKPARRDDRNCLCAQDRFYETHGSDSIQALVHHWQSAWNAAAHAIGRLGRSNASKGRVAASRIDSKPTDA